ncbi:MAG: hypothetical protein Tsb0034_24730 [Ekhidna sp.]
MKNVIIYSLVVLSTFASHAQEGWNWPEDPNLKTQALEKQAYYKLLIAQSKYAEAMKPLNWLYENNPELNPSIYIQGADCLEEVLKKVKSKERQSQLKDSILWMYDQRMKYFDNPANTIDRKAYKAFQLYYKDPSKYPFLAELYAKAYEMNGPEISTFNLSNYMFFAKNYHQVAPDKMTAEKVLDIHTLISDIIEIKKQNGETTDKLKKEQDKTDAWLSSIDGILTCEFIESNLVPKFRENPGDIANAKKIFKYSVQAKCTDADYWLEASETVLKEQPSFSLANALGSKYVASGNASKGMKLYEQAALIATTSEEKHDALMGQASAASKLGMKSKARSLAYEALSAKPGSDRAYNLIGNLYFTSFDDCQGGQSKVLDRGVFLAAYKMYEKAGNQSQMTASKEQFPSIEEIFNEGYEEGQNITVGCWINETVTLKRRD